MDFSLSDELLELKERTERFVRERILPFEGDPRQTPHGPTEELRRELVALGREAGLLSPHVGREWGGLGLDHRAKAVVFEAAGYSPLGPVALNCFAPDEGNMHLLEQVAEERQKEEWLRPMRRAPLPRSPPVPDLRWPFRGPPVEHRAARAAKRGPALR